MRIKHYAEGKFHTIECPEGSRVVRRSELPADGGAIQTDALVVPLNGKEVRTPRPARIDILGAAETGTNCSRLRIGINC